MRRTELDEYKLIHIFTNKINKISDQLGVENTHMEVVNCKNGILFIVNDYPVTKLEVEIEPTIKQIDGTMNFTLGVKTKFFLVD